MVQRERCVWFSVFGFLLSSPYVLTLAVLCHRHTDFLRGLPASELVSLDSTVIADPSALSPADRLRIIYEYVTSTRYDGGLGIVPGSKEWSRIESVVALHDHEFNDLWMRTWTRRQVGFGIGRAELDKIKDHVRSLFSSDV